MLGGWLCRPRRGLGRRIVIPVPLLLEAICHLADAFAGPLPG
jgi:hypothetical protein